MTDLYLSLPLLGNRCLIAARIRIIVEMREKSENVTLFLLAISLLVVTLCLGKWHYATVEVFKRITNFNL